MVYTDPPTSSSPTFQDNGDDRPESTVPVVPVPARSARPPLLDAILAGIALFLLAAGALTWYHHKAQESLIQESRASLSRTAALAATFVDGDALDTVIAQGREDIPAWTRIETPLRRLQALAGDVRYAYVMRLDGDSVRFVVDASPKGDHDRDGIEDHSPIGSSYPWAAPELFQALRDGSRQVDMQLIRDPWGIFLSAYAPVRNSRGTLLGVVGIDLDAREWVRSQIRLREAWLLCLVLIALSSLAAGLGVLLMRRRALSLREKEREDDHRSRVQALRFAQEMETRIQDRTRDLRHANQDLQRALRTRETFLATANHELRTPLQSLMTSVEMLDQGLLGALNAAQHRRVSTIRRCGRHLLDLITQVLDLSRSRSGKVELFVERLDLHALCEECLEILEDEARSREVKFRLRISPSTRWVDGDALRLRQILLNLLGNALQATPPGGTIEIATELAPSGQGISISVCDNGPGVPEEIRPRLFRSLEDPGILSDLNGGLGLPLASWLATLHGGSLRHEPRQGRGSCFVLTLPSKDLGATPQTGSSPQPSSQDPFRMLSDEPTVLLAEDNPDIRESLCEFLEAKGCSVMLASNGREAVDQAMKRRPDLVLMDVQMPVMDGLEATRVLRSTASLEGLPIVVMTAFASGEDAERCREAGATSYVPKPIELRRLDRILSEFVGLRVP